MALAAWAIVRNLHHALNPSEWRRDLDDQLAFFTEKRYTITGE